MMSRGLPCGVCEDGRLTLKHTKRISTHTNRQRAVMTCDKCGHKEVF